MHRTFLILFLLAPWAAAEDKPFVDAQTGLVIRVPDGWERDARRENGSVRFAGIYDLEPKKYVLFTVESGPATGFDPAQWLKVEEKSSAGWLERVDAPFEAEPGARLAGRQAARYTVGGKAVSDRGAYDLRIRGCGTVVNGRFFRITELSYNGAHVLCAKTIDELWQGVNFQEGDEIEEDDVPAEEEDGGGAAEPAEPKPREADITPPAGATESTVTDTAGNYTITLLPGWEATDVSEDPEVFHRLTILRRNANDDILVKIDVVRWQESRSDVFTIQTATDVLDEFMRNNLSFLDQIYGEDARKLLRPAWVRADIPLGSAEKAAGYEFRSVTLDERKKIDEAEALKRRGDPNVVVPDPLPTVIRGRIGMIAPYVYVTRAHFGRPVNDHAELLAEYDKVMDSWEFLSTEAMPPPLESPQGAFGDTRPANPEMRKKQSLMAEANKGGKVVAKLEIDYVLPPGFQVVEQVISPYTGAGYVTGKDLRLQVVAQDDQNGWVWCVVIASSSKLLGSNEKFVDKKQEFDTWISNFESKARATGRLPKKATKVRIGNLSGDGCELEGKIDRFKATEINMVEDKYGWRIKVEIKTRGTGSETFADELKDFVKGFRFTKK